VLFLIRFHRRASLEDSAARALKLDRVGIEDNFFDLGGHSLLATQVVSRIRSAFAIDLPLWELFASPTIVKIAAILDRNRVKHTSDIALARMLGEVEAITEEEAEEMTEIEKSEDKR